VKSLKMVVAAILYYTGILFLLNRVLGSKLTLILSFHRVVSFSEEARSSPTLPYLTASTFEGLIKHLAATREVIGLDQWVNQNKIIGGVILTFDDGWEDNYLYAFPVLNKYKFPATIYLVTNLIGTSETLWQVKLFSLFSRLKPEDLDLLESSDLKERIRRLLRTGLNSADFSQLTVHLKLKSSREIYALLSRLDRGEKHPHLPLFLNWEQVQEMQKHNLSFGSHTSSHIILTVEDQQTVQKELEKSKEVLEKKLGCSIQHFAYPNGQHNLRIRGMVKQAGYVTAVTIQEDISTRHTNSYQLNRIEIEESKVTGRNGRFSRHLFELETCWLYLKMRNLIRAGRSY
jgi:peptidoglycan/xylan/chitin deacetylase (PgdA/CDA1 family)